MQLYFLSYDTAFFWVRASTMKGYEARRAGIRADAIFETMSLKPGAVLVFNRFNTSFFYRLLHQLVTSLGIPYIVDIDDLFWELPDFSNDPARKYPQVVLFTDRLIHSAALVTTSTETLREKIEERYPGKAVRVVQNAHPSWVSPRGGVVIANTDSFKMDSTDVMWFTEVVDRITSAGVPIQLIGENENLLQQVAPFSVDVRAKLRYGEYVEHLAEAGYALGLAPVGLSRYSDCKSSIKLIELLGNGVPVIASDIAPYRRFRAEYPSQPLKLVENTRESWLAAVDEAIEKFPNLEDLHSRTAMLRHRRELQFGQWRAVLDEITARQSASKASYRAVRAFTEIYLRSQRVLRPVLQPAVTFLRGLISEARV